MSQTQDLFIFLRKRDFNSLSALLASHLVMAGDDTDFGTVDTNKMQYDGILLVPLLQSGDKEASSFLLGNATVRSAMLNKDIAHDNWILDIAQKDTFAWLWALEQGWGALVEPRPSMLKHTTILQTHRFIEQYFADAQTVLEDKMDVQAGKNAWDG